MDPVALAPWDTHMLLCHTDRMTVKDLRSMLRAWVAQTPPDNFMVSHWIRLALDRTSTRKQVIDYIRYAHQILELKSRDWADIVDEEKT